ncbi:MAG: O-antigen ligase family protein [Coriobacteriia bacterium]|nr:O-antigen ligase family protein [Coriobacteriia bacterium]
MAGGKRQKGAPAPEKRAAHAAARDAVVAAPGMDLWDRIAWACLHILVVLVPLAMSNLGPFSRDGVPFTYDQFDILKVFFERGLMIVAVSAWLVGLLLRGGRVRFTRGEWVLLAFLGWLILTTVLSVHPATALFGKYRRFEGLLSFLTYGAAFFMSLQLATSASRVRSLARTLAIGGFLVAAYGALQVIGTVGLGAAKVLQPLAAVLAAAVPIVLIYVAIARARGDRDVQVACWAGAAIALVAGVMMAFGLSQNIDVAVATGAQSVALDPIRWGSLPFESNRAFSTFGNPDLLGGYLIFPFAVTLGLALSEKHPLWRSAYWWFTLLNVFVGITSYVRGAWIGAVVSLGLVVFAYRRSTRDTDLKLTPIDLTYIFGTITAAVAVVVASSLRPDVVRNVVTRVISIFQFDQGSAQTRFQIWEAARSAIAERPVFGWGADTFRLLFPMFKPKEYVEAAGYLSVADNVHNYPLQLASGIGIPGALLFYGAIIVALVIAARTAFEKGGAGRNLVLAGLWAAVAGYVVHLMFGLSVTGSTIMMWLAMGVLLSTTSVEHEVKAPSWQALGVGAAVVLCLLGTILNVRYIAADTHYLAGRVLTTGTDRVAEIERAIELNPYNDMYRLELGTAWRDLFKSSAAQYLETVTAGAPDSAVLYRALDYYTRAEAAYEDMIRYVPQEYDTYVFLANLHNEAATYIKSDYAERAVDVAERGIAVEEYGPAIRVQAAMAYLLLDRPDEAVAELEVATELDPNYTQAFMILAEAYERTGRIDEARAALVHVLERYPTNAEAQAALDSLEASAADSTGQ